MQTNMKNTNIVVMGRSGNISKQLALLLKYLLYIYDLGHAHFVRLKWTFVLFGGYFKNAMLKLSGLLGLRHRLDGVGSQQCTDWMEWGHSNAQIVKIFVSYAQYLVGNKI